MTRAEVMRLFDERVAKFREFITREEFAAVSDARDRKSRAIMAPKGNEYSRDDDGLHNFIEGARLDDSDPGTVAKGFMLKHWVSISDLIVDWVDGVKPPQEVIDEKFNDAQNYLKLVEGILTTDPAEWRKE